MKITKKLIIIIIDCWLFYIFIHCKYYCYIR